MDKNCELEMVKIWITIGSIIALMIGWFVNGYLNRKNEIAKERFKYRMTAMQSFLDAWLFIVDDNSKMLDPTFITMLKNARTNFQLYGMDDEIKLFEDFVQNLEKNNLEGLNKASSYLIPLIRQRIRDELKID